ncbi:MAG TPA: hypothetical protein VH561_12535 [Micromonosporaceae bacterium]
MATTPALLAHLVDSATVDIDGDRRLGDALAKHRSDRAAWYGQLIGLLVVRASSAGELERSGVAAGLELAVIADTGLDRLAGAVAVLRRAGAHVGRAEAAVAKRGEDPVPGLRRLLAMADSLAEGERPAALHAEIPLTGGLLDALDVIAEAACPVTLGASFRVGGLAGELFPPPTMLAGVICACRDRGLPFSVSAGLDRAIRHNDHETGFAHHGVLNMLAACLAAAGGAAAPVVAERLASNDPTSLVQTTLDARDMPRPLWTGYASADLADLVHDLTLHDVLSSENWAGEAVAPE